MTMPAHVVTIGLTFRCRLATRTRMFSPCPTHPTTALDAYTLAYPGTLPTPNRRAIDLAMRLALALGAEVAPISRWVRKHFFDPGLPKGYQITQHCEPLARGGRLAIDGRCLELTQLHLSEDLGVLRNRSPAARHRLHLEHAGASLVEIVTAPMPLRTGLAEASVWLREMQAILSASAVASPDTGALRCDATISLRPTGPIGTVTHCTIREITSAHVLERAIAAEIQRQAELMDSGGTVAPRTFVLDPATDGPPRLSGHEAPRYLPEPDLPPLQIDSAWIERVRAELHVDSTTPGDLVRPRIDHGAD